MTTPDNPTAPGPYPGASPYGVPPQPKKSRRKLLFMVLGVVVALIVAIIVIAVVASKGTISSIDDAKAGDCITVSGSSKDATAETAKCDDVTFNFIVAEQLSGDDSKCASTNYSELTQKDKGRLCLVPNLRVDKCYQFAGEGGSITDFKELDCGTPGSGSGAQVAKVTNRADTVEPECAEGSVAVTFDKPKPLGYCLELQSG